MKTQAEIKATKMLHDRTCLNCTYSAPVIRKGEPALRCSLSGRVVNQNMIWCFYGKNKHG